ncbi:hypothetical protein KDA_35830 [Dictyobacter alpinus]|uniref:Polyketide cyclase n=1 Tax=Dictyobacter alpinus TaxID=2014873 RepID=A0A402B9X2_9CHLR|nr:SRPBCC family protein [Dictyobacter alpinus]GCE28099.1 hypothetical protein KDA_35830 [Dictyobacter alpinus]
MNVEKSASFALPASAIFRVITNFQTKSSWQTDVLEAYLVSPGLLQQGASVFQARTYGGRRNETTLIISEYVQDRQLTLETPINERPRARESYHIKPLSEQECRLSFQLELDGIPPVLTFLVRQVIATTMVSSLERLQALLAKQGQK